MHPYVNGNRRTVTLLINAVREKHGLKPMVVQSLSEFESVGAGAKVQMVGAGESSWYWDDWLRAVERQLGN